MSKHQKQEKYSLCRMQRFSDGLTTVRSMLSSLPQVNEGTISKTIKLLYVTHAMSLTFPKFATAVSPLLNKKTTFPDKNSTCDPISLTTTLYPILARELTGKGKALEEFWNEQCKALSQNLWLPTGTGSAVSPTTSSSSFWTSTTSNSWFSTKQASLQTKSLLPTSSLSSMSTVVNKWVGADTKQRKQHNVSVKELEKERKRIAEEIAEAKRRRQKREKAKRKLKKEKELSPEEEDLLDTKLNPKARQKTIPNSCVRVRILPTNEQSQIFLQWMGSYRYTWNCARKRIEEGINRPNAQELKKDLVTDKNLPREFEWLKKTPKDIRDGAVRDISSAYSSAFTNLKNGNIKRFSIGYKSKKRCTREVVPIPKSALEILEDSVCIYKSRINRAIKLHKKSDISHLAENIAYDMKLLRYKSIGYWYILVPRTLLFPVENQEGEGIVSIDPGSRSFITTYSPDGKCEQIGYNDMKKKIVPLFKRLDKLSSDITKETSPVKRRRMKRRMALIRFRIANMKDDTHYKTALHLCRNYRIIILPVYGSRSMVESHTLSRAVNRRILCWNHYRFRQRLLCKAQQYGRTVLLTTEEYTTQTCTRCGTLNKVGGAEVYRCSDCRLHIDRDVNAARNILMRTIVTGD